MQKLHLTLLSALLLCAFAVRAQIVTTEPAVLQETSENVVIYFHADQGNKGLNNQPESSPVYAHTGVITNKSANSSDWKYAPTWLDNSDKYRLTYVSPNLWKLNIGNIRQYYGITNSEEKVKQLAFVFRDAQGTREGKTASGGDIFINVVDNGLQVSLSCNLEGTLITPQTNNVTFTASCTQPAELTISINGNNIARQAGTTSLSTTYLFENFGTYNVVATATSGNLTAQKELTLTYPESGTSEPYPGGVPKQGAVRQPDGSVLFCIAAPMKASALIVGAWDDYAVRADRTMKCHDYNGNRYFWTKIEGLSDTDAYPYYYLIDGIAVGDPYSRLILDPKNDKYISPDVYPGLIPYPADKVPNENLPLAVYQENINNYNWQVNNFRGAAKEKLVIYELLLRDFTGNEGEAKGNGTLEMARTKIPYLKTLGVNAVELLPINEFNGNNSWGYNPNFYFAPDKAYGTPDAYKAFIDECHANGIAVIIDIVFNQSDWMHPWYQLYPAGSNPFYNAEAPHAYSVLNDWNQTNPLVQQQFEDCLRYWLTEYKIDGFRFDLVKGLGDNNSYANSGDAATNAYNPSRIRRMKRLHEVVKEVNPDAYFINENLAGPEEENEMAADGQLNWANINHPGSQYAMGFSAEANLKRFYAPDDNRIWGSTVSYLESHDEQRLAYLQNQHGATGVKGNLTNSMHRLGSAAVQMLLSPGAHMIWQFSELGNFDNTKKPDGGNSTDPKTVRWNLLDNAARHGLYDTYCELNALRSNNPELFANDAQFQNQLAVANWTQGRFMYLSAGNKELICVINPETEGEQTYLATFRSSNNDDYQILSRSYDTNPSFNAANNQVTVPANCYVIIGNNNVKDVKGISTDNNEVQVYGDYGKIAVEGPCNDLQVYDLAGRRMQTLTLPAGIYLVRANGRSFKVAVR